MVIDVVIETVSSSSSGFSIFELDIRENGDVVVVVGDRGIVIVRVRVKIGMRSRS